MVRTLFTLAKFTLALVIIGCLLTYLNIPNVIAPVIIAAAASLGKTKKYRTQNYPEFEKNFSDIFQNLPFTQSKQSMIKEEIGEQNYQFLQHIKQITNQQGIQARMPYEMKIN